MSTVIDVQVRKPFPGLRPFRQGEEHLFFGRESQLHAMIDKLSSTRFLAVVGTSGSGKSSLVNCGLRPALHGGLMAKAGTAWRVAQFRPGGSPLRSLACALSKEGALFSDFDSSQTLVEIIDASIRMSKLGLSRIYHDARLPEDTNLLVVVDQFEELFRYRQIPSAAGDETQQRNQDAVAFVNLLLDAKTHPEIPIYVVLTMRSDFLGDCAEFEGLPEAINEGEYLIPRLTRDERKAAIAGPLRVGGAEISPVLLTKLVNDVGDNPDQLSILQHALNRTWAYWEHEGHCQGPLDLQHYEAIGTMAHALDQHAEKAFRELPSERHQRICERIFKTLTDRSTDSRGIRRPTKFSVLCKIAQVTPSEVTAVLAVFRKPSRSFVMPPLPEELEDETIIDISHESLMRIWQRLITWTHEEVLSAQLYRRLAETASLNAEGKEGLWRDPGLQSALDWREKERPTESWAELYGGDFGQTISFLEQSEQQRNREKQEKDERRQYELQQAQALAAEREQRLEEQARAAARLRNWLRVVLAASVCSICLGLVAGWLGYKANRASKDKDRALTYAQARTREAQAADHEMRLEALRVRDLNLDSQNQLAETADELLKYTDPQLSTRWRLTKAQAYLSVGKYDDAIDLLSRVLESVPGDFEARTSRGYVQVLRKRPGDGLRDFEYIRENIDRLSPLNNLNLTVTNAALGHDAAARASLAAAIDGMLIREYEGGGDSSLPPEITSATGRVTLQSSGATFETALYYMRANLESYVGDVAAFERALAEADRKALSLSPAAMKDAYFVAMTWAWFQCREPGKDCNDYGALASQAALWQRAEFKDWANCYYERFEQQNMRFHDNRYRDLANWVEHAKTALGSSRSCSDLKDPEDDVFALGVKAREAEARKDFPEAWRLLNVALGNLSKSGPAERNPFLLAKANVLLEIGQGEMDAYSADNSESHKQKSRAALQELEKVCTEISKTNPRSSIAHIYYALAESWLDPNSREKVLNELGTSLRLDPDNLDALRLIDQLVPAGEPEQSSYLKKYRAFLERYYKISPYQASTLEHEARLAMMDHRYGDALNIVETAIAMDPIDSRSFSLNQLRAEIQQAMGFDTVEVTRNLATGYQQARLMRKMRENARPEDAEAKAWETLAELAKKGPNERLRCNSEVTVCNLITTIEVHSETVVSSIAELHQDSEDVKSLVAKIDRGRDDGVVMGSNGSVWPQYSKGGDGHERALSQLGNAEVLSVDAHSALVRIHLGQPKGDVVRDRDLVMLNARVPLRSDRSSLWSAARFNIMFVDANDHEFFDYSSLYSNETPESDSRMFQRMVEDIQHAASAFSNDSKILEKGAFAGQSLQQALQRCDEPNLKKLLDYVVKNPRNRAGKRITLSKEYALWAQNGAPSE